MNLQELEQAWCCASSYMKNSLVFYGLPRRSDDGELFIFWLDLPGIDKKTMLMLTQHTAFRGAKTIPTRTGELNCKLRKGDTKHFSKKHQRNNNIRRIHTRTHAHIIYMKRERAHETEGIRSSYTRPQRTLFDEPYNYIHTYNYAGSPIRSN